MPLVRILSWNILQGGGRRSAQIVDVVAKHHPDVFLIQEYRDNSEKHNFQEQLHHLGLTSFYTPVSESSSENKLAIAARWPFEVVEAFPVDVEQQIRCQRVHFTPPDAEIDLSLVNLHLPHKKAQLPVFDYLLDLEVAMVDSASILMGDFNCGIPYFDSETRSFENSARFQQLLKQGWLDSWRLRNPNTREFTWISSKKANGYRYDNALVSPELDGQIKTISYDHEVRKAGVSDHSAMYMDIRFPDSEY